MIWITKEIQTRNFLFGKAIAFDYVIARDRIACEPVRQCQAECQASSRQGTRITHVSAGVLCQSCTYHIIEIVAADERDREVVDVTLHFRL